MPAEGTIVGVSRFTKKVFLSYAHADRKQANGARALIEFGGAQVFMDWRSILPGAAWEDDLMRALASCDILCVFWSAAAQRSKWVQAEYTIFMQNFPERPCVPLCADATPLPPLLAARQAMPDSLALTNRLVDRQRELHEQNVSSQEIRRILRQHLAQVGLELDESQLRKAIWPFTGGIAVTLGVWLSAKWLKAAVLLTVAPVIILVWRYSTVPPSARNAEATNAPASVPNPRDTGIGAGSSAAAIVGGDETALLANDRGSDGAPCNAKDSRDPRCKSTYTPTSLHFIHPYVDAPVAPPTRAISKERANGDASWIKLGERRLNNADVAREHIDLDNQNSEFAKLKLLANNCDLEILDFQTTFRNSEIFRADGRHSFENGSPAFVIDLPNPERVVAGVDVVYRRSPRPDCSVIEVWGPARSSSGIKISADMTEANIRQVADSSYKVRLAAVLALSKAHEPRAVITLAEVLRKDTEPTIRRVAALALSKMIDARTADDAKDVGLNALAEAAANDSDVKVRAAAARAVQDLSGLRRTKQDSRPENADKPDVFVNIDSITDQSMVMPSDADERLVRVVKRRIELTGYATTWPGGLPTKTDLTTSHSRAFIVALTVKKIEFSKVNRQTQVSCRVEIRVAPWSGVDGGEKWEANKAASVSGSAKAVTGNSDREIADRVRDCLEAVAEAVTTRHILPFLKRIAGPANSAQ